MFKLDLEKAEESEIKLPTSVGSWETKRIPEKHLLLLNWLYQSFWLCVSQQTGKFFKRWEYQTTWPVSWEICMQVKKQLDMVPVWNWTWNRLVPDWETRTSRLCHLAYLTYVQSTSWEMTGWMKHKIESILPGEISANSDTQMTPPLWQKAKRN